MELCAEKLETNRNDAVSELDCNFTFNLRIVRQALRISQAKLQHLLGVCSANGLLSFEFSGNSLKISMPILLKLLERNAKKGHRSCTVVAQKLHPEEEEEVDKEEERKYIKEKTQITPSNPTQKFNARHKFNLVGLYEIYPRVQKKTASINALSELFSKPGVDKKFEKDFETAIKNYSEYCKNRAIKFEHILTMPNFILEWRDWLDSSNGTSKVEKKELSVSEYIAQKELEKKQALEREKKLHEENLQ